MSTKVTTSTDLTLYAKNVKSSNGNTFLDNFDYDAGLFKVPSRAIGSFSAVPVQNKALPAKFIFNLRKDGCPVRSGDGKQLYFGDYVQLSSMKNGVRMYYSPGNGGNDFQTVAGDCQPGSWQTFQILKVDSSGNVSTGNNAPITLDDKIILINTNYKNAINVYVKDGVSSNAAGLGKTSYKLQPQYTEGFHSVPIDYETLANISPGYMEYAGGYTDKWIALSIIVLFLLLMLGVTFYLIRSM